MNPSSTSTLNDAIAQTAVVDMSDTPRVAHRVLKFLRQLPQGMLLLTLPNGALEQCGTDAKHCANMTLHDWEVLHRVLRTGDIGLATSYRDGLWSTTQLTDLIHLLILNRQHLESLIYGSWWGSLLYRIKHGLQRNSKSGSPNNIHAHYDLGNDFYGLWLDSQFNYSSAYFAGDTQQSLEVAQSNKNRRALDAAGVVAHSRLLEIGCGWGTLASMAVQERAASVVGITLSTEQLSYGKQRLQDKNISTDAAQLLYMDYRDAAKIYRHQPFDAIVSIEMFEAVGKAYWRQYFALIRDCLKPGCRACIQTITLRDDLFDRYQKSTDFIQQYIFPGGFLPSVKAFVQAAESAGLNVVHQEAFGQDYAQTLQRWRKKFLSKKDEVSALGFDAPFVRLWEFYLAYCEAAFLAGNTDVVQFTLMHKKV